MRLAFARANPQVPCVVAIAMQLAHPGQDIDAKEGSRQRRADQPAVDVENGVLQLRGAGKVVAEDVDGRGAGAGLGSVGSAGLPKRGSMITSGRSPGVGSAAWTSGSQPKPRTSAPISDRHPSISAKYPSF